MGGGADNHPGLKKAPPPPPHRFFKVSIAEKDMTVLRIRIYITVLVNLNSLCLFV